MKNKKIFPKIKKKLKGFLTDESGKITKKDALGLAAGAVLLSGVEDVAAGGHSSSYKNAPGANGHTSGNGGNCTVTKSYSNHGSGIVNGHYSSNITGTTSGVCHGGTYGHGNTSHGSHSSHGSHGSHGQW